MCDVGGRSRAAVLSAGARAVIEQEIAEGAEEVPFSIRPGFIMRSPTTQVLPMSWTINHQRSTINPVQRIAKIRVPNHQPAVLPDKKQDVVVRLEQSNGAMT